MAGFGGRIRACLDWVTDSMDRHPHRWLAACALLLAMQVSPYWHVTSDSVSYLSIARSLARGDGLANLGSRQLYFAPGYPLLISPAFLAGDRPIVAVSAINALFAIGLMIGVYVWIRRSLPQAAVLLTGLVVLNASLWMVYRRPLSETAFMAALVWMALAMQAALANGSRWRFVGLVAAASALASLLVSIRHAGAMCVAGAVLAIGWNAWKGRAPLGRGLVLGLCAALPAVATLSGMLAHERAQKRADSYVDQVVDRESSLPAQVVEGVRLRMCEVGTVLVPGMFKSYGSRGGTWFNANVFLFAAVFAAVAWGWRRACRGELDLLMAVWPPYLALYLVWPHDQGNRFTVPMLPVLVVSLWTFFERWLSETTRRRLFVELLAAHAGVAVVYWVSVERPRAQADHAQWAVIERFAASASGHAVLARGMPESLRFMLSFQLDRPVRDWDERGSDRASAWVVAPAGHELAGYRQAASAGEWRLLAPAGASPAAAVPGGSPSAR